MQAKAPDEARGRSPWPDSRVAPRGTQQAQVPWALPVWSFCEAETDRRVGLGTFGGCADRTSKPRPRAASEGQTLAGPPSLGHAPPAPAPAGTNTHYCSSELSAAPLL